MSSIMKGLVDEQDIEETKKLSAQEKFKRSMARAGYDMDAGAKRLQDLLDRQKKEREELEKKELKNVSEDDTLQFAKEKTPRVNPYGGLEDVRLRGAIGEELEKIDEDLRKWFKEKWVRFGPDGKIRGACARGSSSEGKPKCLPQAKAHALGKKGRKYAAAKKRREDPNPERSGPAKNVATKKKSSEGVQENMQANYKNYSTQDLLRMIKTIKRDEIGMKIIKAISNELIRRKEGVAEDSKQNLSIQNLATISDEALDKAYGYGRSTPGNTFGWQANLMSAAYAKKMIDAGVTDIEKISDAIHKGWWSVAQKFVDNPDQFDDTKKLRDEGKLDKKMQQRIDQMVPYNQLTDDQKEIDRIVARALLQAIKGQQGVAGGLSEMDNRTPSGDRREQTANSPEERNRREKELQDLLKKTPPELRKKLGLPEPKEQGVAEGLEQQYLWHGSRQKIPMLEPRQSIDTGGAAGSNQNAIYATSDPKVAIAMGLTTPGSDTGMFPNDPQMVLFSGKIRKGENVYLHKVPMNGPDGKPQFVQGGNSREFHSVPGVKGIKPIEIKAVPVDKYLNLIRQATPQDLELRKKYMKQGVAEGFSDISGLLSASNLNNSYIITAELAEGGKKKFRVKAQNERVAIEKFKKHHSMANIISVKEEGVKEGSKYPRNPASYHLKKYPVPQDQMARPVKKEPKKPEKKPDEKLDELKCWPGYSRVKGVPAGAPGSCKKKTNEEHQQCPECGGAMYEVSLMNEKKDACYYKVKSRYKVWPSAYASGALVKCRKKGAKNWGNKSNESHILEGINKVNRKIK